MSAESGTEDRTEEPTEKKLRDAAEKGDVANSREAPLFACLLAALLVCSLLIRDGALRVAEALAHLLDDAGRWPMRNGSDVMSLLAPVGQAAAAFLVPIVLVFIVAGLAMSFAQALPSVALDRIAPKLSKISPMAGAGRLFGRQGFVEFAKGAAKLLAVGFVVFLLLRSEQQTVIDAMFTEAAGVPERTLGIVVRLLSGVAIAFALLTVVDFIWAKVTWRNRMRMSRQEVKDEMKQAEGDPLFKAKRRSVALDRSRRRMIAEVPRATMVIANPTHYAIALRYVRSETSAPVVIAKGQDIIALKIREIAEEHGIAVIENKPLARSMYDQVEVSQTIPAEFYKAVAEIIHHLQSKSVRPAMSKQPVIH